jgi:hypothetical protein
MIRLLSQRGLRHGTLRFGGQLTAQGPLRETLRGRKQ